MGHLSQHGHNAACIYYHNYTKRWPTEVCFKESKQLLEFGKDQSNDFNAPMTATTLSFLRYNILNYFNSIENHGTLGSLFEHIADASAVKTYAHRLWNFFRDLFTISMSNIFETFQIDQNVLLYIEGLSDALKGFGPFQGCDT